MGFMKVRREAAAASDDPQELAARAAAEARRQAERDKAARKTVVTGAVERALAARKTHDEAGLPSIDRETAMQKVASAIIIAKLPLEQRTELQPKPRARLLQHVYFPNGGSSSECTFRTAAAAAPLAPAPEDDAQNEDAEFEPAVGDSAVGEQGMSARDYVQKYTMESSRIVAAQSMEQRCREAGRPQGPLVNII